MFLTLYKLICQFGLKVLFSFSFHTKLKDYYFFLKTTTGKIMTKIWSDLYIMLVKYLQWKFQYLFGAIFQNLNEMDELTKLFVLPHVVFHCSLNWPTGTTRLQVHHFKKKKKKKKNPGIQYPPLLSLIINK